MKISDYCKEKAVYMICHLLVISVTILMLVALNPAGGKQFSILVGVLYLTGASIPLIVEYRQKKAFYTALNTSFARLDQKNLIAEVLDPPNFYEGIQLYDILRASNKAYLEEMKRYKNMQADYREYIELWVHEIKTPISSSKLIVQNNASDAVKSIGEELDTIESYVEQALFYARSNTVENDYMIKEITLEKPVFNALKRDSALLIRQGVSISLGDLDFPVFSDAKWLEFILHQLLINAIKYAKETAATISISAEEKENCCILTVSDNGMGITENDLPRIFEKGFTGTNGRLKGKSTGMGLYISKKLCEKLGLTIGAESVYGDHTTICIVFPKSSMTNMIATQDDKNVSFV